jgi:hypothetical protein
LYGKVKGAATTIAARCDNQNAQTAADHGHRIRPRQAVTRKSVVMTTNSGRKTVP